MLFLTSPDYYIQDQDWKAVGNRIIYAICYSGPGLHDIILIQEYSLIEHRMVCPPELVDNSGVAAIAGFRLPGDKHRAPRLGWLPPVNGRQQLRVVWEVKAAGTDAARIVYDPAGDLPFFRAALQ